MNSSTPRLDIVTLNYNQGRFLRDAVESILAQEYLEWRLVICDPGSTDGSQQLYSMPFIDRDTRISVIQEPDRGPADALNKGFAVGTGKYCYYLNADDRASRGAFVQALKILNENADVDAVVGHGHVIDEWGIRQRRIYSDKFIARNYVLGRAVAVQQATFFRRSLLDISGGFNIMNRTSWDGQLLFDATVRGANIQTRNQFWGEFRIYDGTITSDATTRVASRKLLAGLASEHGLASTISPLAALGLEARRRIAHPFRSTELLFHRAVGAQK